MVIGQLEHVENQRQCAVWGCADIHGQLVVPIRNGFHVSGREQDVTGLPLMARPGLHLERRQR